MDPIIILYSGGHAKQCIDLFLETSCNQPIFCFDDCYKNIPLPFYRSSTIIGTIEDYETYLNQNSSHKTFIAAGDNSIRQNIYMKYPNAPYINCVSQFSYISPGSSIGIGNYIGIHTKIAANSKLGNFNICNDGSTIMHDCQIGDFNHLAPNCSLGGRVSIGKLNLIGTNSTINPNCKIENQFIVGSQSVVLSSYQNIDPCIWMKLVGIPAKLDLYRIK